MRLSSILKKRRNARTRKCQRRLALECLEQRRVMAVSLELSGTVLNITGDGRNDTVDLIEMPSSPYSPAADLLTVAWKDDLGQTDSEVYATPLLTKIVFNGNGGIDTLRNVYNPTGAPTFANPWFTPEIPVVVSMLPSIEAHGGGGSDFLYGGPRTDWLYGDDGNDFLYGNWGDDVLEGGRQDDMLFGGRGDDKFNFGNSRLGGVSLGIDSVVEHANEGTDTLEFGANTNGVSLNLGIRGNQVVNRRLTLNLTVLGSIENVNGTLYNDVIRGNALDNVLCGCGANDTLHGMAGNDSLYGGPGADALYGGAGADDLYGGAGDDTLVSIDSFLNDDLWGDGGDDSFWIDESGWGLSETVHDISTVEAAHNLHAVYEFANRADKTLDGDLIADPGAGVRKDGTAVGFLRYRNFSSQPLFASTGPSPLDVDQGDMGDCWLMSALGSAAKANPNSIRQTVVALGDGTYAVELGDNVYRVDADLPIWSQVDTRPQFAGRGQQGSIWVPIIEKAYAFYRPANHSPDDTYGVLDRGWSADVFRAIGASGLVRESFANGIDALVHIFNELAVGKAVVVNILNGLGIPGLDIEHAYMVERASYSLDGGGPNEVVLRNPHADDTNRNDGVNQELITLTGAQLVAAMWGDDEGIHSAWV